jgi:hypothetical protein
MQMELKQRPAVMTAQRQLLASRFDMTPRFDPQIKMLRGKPICVGPTARSAEGMTFEQQREPAVLARWPLLDPRRHD